MEDSPHNGCLSLRMPMRAPYTTIPARHPVLPGLTWRAVPPPGS